MERLGTFNWHEDAWGCTENFLTFIAPGPFRRLEADPGLSFQNTSPLLTRSFEPFLSTFAWQPILKIALAERLDRERIRSDRVFCPIVIVSPFHAQLLSADADRHSR